MSMSPTQTLSTHSPEPSRGNQLSRNLKAKLGIKQILGGEWLVLFVVGGLAASEEDPFPILSSPCGTRNSIPHHVGIHVRR